MKLNIGSGVLNLAWRAIALGLVGLAAYGSMKGIK